MFAKVMLYMCPQVELSVFLQKVDPILATSFYIWYVMNNGKEYITKAKNPEVGIFNILINFCKYICYGPIHNLTGFEAS